MYLQSKKIKLNDNFISELLKDSDSSLSKFDDFNADKTYNPVSASESNIPSG